MNFEFEDFWRNRVLEILTCFDPLRIKIENFGKKLFDRAGIRKYWSRDDLPNPKPGTFISSVKLQPYLGNIKKPIKFYCNYFIKKR